MQADNDSTKKRLRIIRGQIDGILKMIEDDRYCIDISNQLMAVISALKSVNKTVLTEHLHHCVHSSMQSNDKDEVHRKLDEISEIINKLAK